MMGASGNHARLVRRAAPIIAAVAAVLVIGDAGPASAALCARWSDHPGTVSADSAASISFQTFVPVSTRDGRYRLDPFALDYPFRVRAISPDGRIEPIRVAPSSENAQTWRGSFVPNQSGTWSLAIENLTGSEAECYEDASLRVVAAPGPTPASPAVTLGLAGLVIALVTLIVLFVGRRRALRS